MSWDRSSDLGGMPEKGVFLSSINSISSSSLTSVMCRPKISETSLRRRSASWLPWSTLPRTMPFDDIDRAVPWITEPPRTCRMRAVTAFRSSESVSVIELRRPRR